MTRLIFVDTSAFIARYVVDDAFHAAAVSEHERLMRAGCHYVTSNYVFDEMVTRVQHIAGHSVARQAGDLVLQHPCLLRRLIDERIERDAWKLHLKFGDQPLSFTDVTTVALMRELAIREIFSFDSDFDRVGLVRLPAAR
jgi:predicted nucleic acid-binding protein